MTILGLSCYYHDSSACLIGDGKLIAAAQEERFDRNKYSSAFPINSINYCLQSADLTSYDIDYVAFYEKPFLKFERIILNHLKSYPFSLKNFLDTMPSWLKDRLILPLTLKEELGFRGDVFFIKHHLAHEASAFLISPFDRAAILTVDGVGEWATTTYGVGEGNKINVLKELKYPNSLGLLYSIVTTYLGFRVFSGEGKIMALAETGNPKYLDEFKKMVDVRSDGSFRLNKKYFYYNKGERMYSNKFVKLFGKPRLSKESIEDRHRDIAASLQKMIEEIILKVVGHIYKETGLDNLCLAGGVFLNVTTNTRIVKESPFKKVFIQPAAGDNGSAVGAAFYTYNSLKNKPRKHIMNNACLGPEYSNKKINILLSNKGAKFKRIDNDGLVKYVAKKISENKIIGWFQGRMEFGPRALGSRSILANPINKDMKDILNKKVKHRESFRPFAVSILRERLSDFFELDVDSPFMLLVGKVRGDKKKLIPSALHNNNTSRIQTVTKKENGIYYDLINEFKNITGIPMIMNTSFNDNNEPIVCSPEEAYNCFMKTGIDYLIMGNYIVKK
jgi:carbamoyltransferase